MFEIEELCPKCGCTDIAIMYVAPEPVYAGGCFVRNSSEEMWHRCKRCKYKWEAKISNPKGAR